MNRIVTQFILKVATSYHNKINLNCCDRICENSLSTNIRKIYDFNFKTTCITSFYNKVRTYLPCMNEHVLLNMRT